MKHYKNMVYCSFSAFGWHLSLMAMPKLSETQLQQRDATRDLNTELLEPINQMNVV